MEEAVRRMADLINGRTPEEIKAGLKACTTGKTPGYGCNAHCPYLNVPNCWLPVKADALALIEHLEAKVPRRRAVCDCVLHGAKEGHQAVLGCAGRAAGDDALARIQRLHGVL